MNVARYMVQGCDVWLNNPRRPLEASGTSGMKIIANGGLNFSVLDGWWDEGYTHEVGWKIGGREEYLDLDYQDEVEANMLYKTLEKNIAMQFYKKGADGLPRDWIKKMKNSMSQLTPVFNTHRMVQQYTEKFYLNAKKNRINLIKNSWAEAKEFTKWESNLLANWDKIKFVSVNHNGNGEEMKVGDKFNITTEISADGLTNSDFEVQIYFGKLDNVNEANENSFQTMTCVDCNESANNYKYTGSIVCNTTGEFGYTLRILPKHPLLINQFELGAIKWVS
jgi:starch phosphorylase